MIGWSFWGFSYVLSKRWGEGFIGFWCWIVRCAYVAVVCGDEGFGAVLGDWMICVDGFLTYESLRFMPA
jgi:hypothetical protein